VENFGLICRKVSKIRKKQCGKLAVFPNFHIFSGGKPQKSKFNSFRQKSRKTQVKSVIKRTFRACEKKRNQSGGYER